jgi:hypothetical protein
MLKTTSTESTHYLPTWGGTFAPLRQAVFFAFFHLALAAFFARLVFASAVMILAAFTPPSWPRQAGQ